MGVVSAFVCDQCDAHVPGADVRLGVCGCGGLLLAQYKWNELARRWSKQGLAGSSKSLWRYAPVLPAELLDAVTLHEGWTPLLQVPLMSKYLNVHDLRVKDESRNPTCSQEARGMSVVVTMARQAEFSGLAMASSGDSGGALAAYSAQAGLSAHLFLPRDVPQANFLECKRYGAFVTLVDGSISDCGENAARAAERRDHWLDVSPWKEPHGVEGKKTAGYELAEQMEWELPDVIFCPGDDLVFIGIWKAFRELQELGWIGSKLPKMIMVQEKGGRSAVDLSAHPSVRKVIRESVGTICAVSTEEMLDDALLLSSKEGVCASLGAGGCVAALRRFLKEGLVTAKDRVVLFNTESGLKRGEAYSTRFIRRGVSEQDKLGGLITPR